MIVINVQILTNHDEDDGDQNRDEDGRVVQLRGHGGHGLEVRVGLGLVCADDVLQRRDGLAEEVVSHAADVRPVLDSGAQSLLENHEVVEEVALAAPEVAGEAEAGQQGVGGQLPDGEGAQEVVIQPQDCQLHQAGECVGCDTWRQIDSLFTVQ